MSSTLAQTFKAFFSLAETGSASGISNTRLSSRAKDALKGIWKDLLEIKDLENEVLWDLINIRRAYALGHASPRMNADSCLRAFQGCQAALESFADFQRSGELDEGEEDEPTFLMSCKVTTAVDELADASKALHENDVLTLLGKLESIRLIIASRLHFAKKTMHAFGIIQKEEPKRVRKPIKSMQKAIEILHQVDWAVREIIGSKGAFSPLANLKVEQPE